jgi:hypothetical protein
MALVRKKTLARRLGVSWGGFAAPLLIEVCHLHFDLPHDQLSPGIQAEPPLKRIWVRLPEASGEER